MTNRLASETSPYLRQHADNPVDWWPWTPEAFDEARRREVPVLLSVGYSACHWCHVMAHESFEDPATAEVMNELFVNVKVDREERPDVDAVYMDAVQALTGHGGWPMTVWLTPSGEPFFGGTYFPPEPRHGMPSFLDVCRAVANAYRDRRPEVAEQAARLTESLGRLDRLEPTGDQLDPSILTAAVRSLDQQFDEEWGGFGRPPKFPQAMNLDLLLRHHAHSGDRRALEMATATLDAMASGGMYDHLGGGFARYSVDRQWLVPHFEKMLYDQALLARAYLHAWQLTGEGRYRQVVDEVMAYVLRDLRHPDGGFHSAEDADSEGEEGKFYVWTTAEIRQVVADEDLAAEAIAWYGVTEEGNFEGANILHRPERGRLERPPGVEEARRRLFAARAGRVRPGLDDKVLTEWNGLFVATLAEAGAATGTPEWVEAAVAAADFLLANLRGDDGRWLRSWQAEGGARHRGYAADHAAMVDAFVRLHEATGEARWVSEARAAADVLIDRYRDTANGGFFTTADDADDLVTRPKDLLDNALPSANSAAAVALARLHLLTGEERYRAAAESVLALVAATASEHPTAFGHALAAVDVLGRATEIVVAGDRPDLVEVAHRRFTPAAVLAWGERFESPLWVDRVDGRAYVCSGFACKEPAADAATLAAQLG